MAEGAAERVRVVSPHVELNLRRAGRMRMLALRETEERAHEGERRLCDERLRQVLERIETACDNEVRRIDSMHGSGDGFHHPAVHACRVHWRQVETEIRLIPDLVDMHRRLAVEPVVPERES